MNRKFVFFLVGYFLYFHFLLLSGYAGKEFYIGETYRYNVKWIKLSVGTITVEVTGEATINGRGVYVLEFNGQTNRAASVIYRIRDRIVSYIDKEDHIPLKLEVSRREGSYKKDAVTLFDYKKKKAYFHNFLDKSSKAYDIPSDVHDILSVFYHLRFNPITLNEEQRYEVTFAETIFSIFGTARRKKQIKLAQGKRVFAYYAEPYAKIGTREVKDGAVSVYISADEYQVPVCIVLKAPLFTRITAKLCEDEPLRQ
ncbi:MAG: DUF3108 domain-containing protein [Candidatus Omnitrophica bacterium]|nr:DUF3108 domain-containing protein [Candidatus Omnitrophota bacterium]